ncbi:class C sortase [Bifidobacterium adolescentis]|uniref:class C sortase n=1 Tax=Bifidobacterium adolescentis TaxID=1680 RepID=UPI003D01769D
MSRHKARGPKASIGSSIASTFFGAVLIAGLCLLTYPTIANWWNQLHQSRAVAAYVAQTKDYSRQERKVMIAQARQYNADLAQKALLSTTENENDRWVMTDAEKRYYDSTLDITGTGVMGYVTIPSIAVRLPIYHGTDEGILQIATGHIAGSSLPVGGDTTHAVVSGHTGLPSAKLFTGLDKLKKGDTFAFHVLDQTYTYQVDQIKTVLPKDLSQLNIEPGKDYATLVTCTPYGVNTHRLLVRGHRIPTPKTADTTDYDARIRLMSAVIITSTVLVIAAIAWWLVASTRRYLAEKRGEIVAADGAMDVMNNDQRRHAKEWRK